ncbi:MAG: antibiotic biosynthesis monooxygenase family protein [Terriglobales bacterium]
MVIVVWEFQVKAGKNEEFEKHYGANGTWAEFFRRDATYRGTQLVRDLSDAQRYATMDTWEDEEAYGAFRAVNRQEYAALDQEMEALTESEKRVGIFAQL